MPAEFDLLARDYDAQHRANIGITGEDPAYFAEYKVADLAMAVGSRVPGARRILDFGSGIGNSIPFFRRHFPNCELTCADASERSMEIASARYPGAERQLLVTREIPLPSRSQDIVFSACVFHHIPHVEHLHWLSELRRVTRAGGILAIYEHNPLNPLTVHAVRTCPLDVNAQLVHAATLRRCGLAAGWQAADISFKVFFPAPLKFMRPLERCLGWLPLGAQYRLCARR